MNNPHEEMSSCLSYLFQRVEKYICKNYSDSLYHIYSLSIRHIYAVTHWGTVVNIKHSLCSNVDFVFMQSHSQVYRCLQDLLNVTLRSLIDEEFISI